MADFHPSRCRFRILLTLASAFGIVSAFIALPVAQTIEQQVFVSVVDRNEDPVPNLGPDDFIVREDGQAREVLRVSRAATDMQIAVLVDNSQASGDAIVDIRRGVAAFIEAMSPGNQLSLITYGGPPRILVESTTQVASLQAAANRLFPQSDSAAYLVDALVETSRGFERSGATRPIIVIVGTSGLDLSSTDGAHAIEQLKTSGAALHPVVLDVNFDSLDESAVRLDGVSIRNQQVERDLAIDRGAAETGGVRRDLLASTGFESALARVAGHLSNQYLVVYGRPDTLIPPERLEVSVRQSDATARATRVAKG